MAQFDVVIIGAGQNGLVAANVLARKGRRVLVVEKRPVIGGLCAGEEFHPGYRHAGLHQDTSMVRRHLVDDLRLRDHGLQWEDTPPDVFVPQQEGPGLLLSHDAARAQAEIATHSQADAAAYGDFRAFLARVAPNIAKGLNAPMPDIHDPSIPEMLNMARSSLAVRRLGSDTMMDLFRIPPMCVADWLRESFESELLNAALAGPALIGTWTGPWSPGTAANLMMHACTASGAVRGGPAQWVGALAAAAQAQGVEIRTGAAVQSIRVQAGRVQGVQWAAGDGGAGDAVDAPIVLSSCDPKTTFLSLLGPRDISHAFESRIRIYRARGTTTVVHLALQGQLRFACRPDHVVQYARTGETLDDQERAFDAVKYRQWSPHPILDIHVPSVADPTRAPDGHSVVSILAHFVPFDLEGGWNDARRAELGDHIVAALRRYAPDIDAAIVARQVLTPADIADTYGTWEGHLHHGEHALDQLLMRPNVDATRYATELPGLFLCGGGTHPGGGVHGANGALAAQQVLASR